MSDELMRVLPYPWPCVMCGRELTSLYHEPSLPVAMGGPGPSGHLFVPLLGCSIHGSDRAPLMAMTCHSRLLHPDGGGRRPHVLGNRLRHE